jgi:hypothetical protein
MVKPYLDQVGGKVGNDVTTFTGGLNTYQDKAYIEENEMPYMINMTMYKPPMMSTRQSRKSILPDLDFPEFGDVKEIYAYNDDYIVCVANEHRNPDTADSVITVRKDIIGNYRTFSHILNTNWQKYYLCYARTQLEEYVYITNTQGKYKLTMDRTRGTAGAESMIQIVDNHYGIPCWHKGRMFFADPSTNTVTFSALNDFENFDETVSDDPLENDYSVIAGHFFVTNARGKITALVSFDDKLYIFCEHSIHVVYGSTPDTTSSNFFTLVDLNNNLGTLDDRYVTVGGGNLYWFGDDRQIYEHTGSYTHMISRPYSTRSGASYGGIDNIIEKPYFDKNRIAKLSATSDKLYVNISLDSKATVNQYLFVYDIMRRNWWCEDGKFETICNFSHDNNNILMCTPNGDILKYTNEYLGYDSLYNFSTSKADEVPIEYEFHTRVVGAEGTDTKKTLSEVWLQAVADAEVYINDIWTSRDIWRNPEGLEENYKLIGKLKSVDRTPSRETYNQNLYEQQRCIVEKMYGQRLNTFQIIVKGTGASMFYQIKRIWRVA